VADPVSKSHSAHGLREDPSFRNENPPMRAASPCRLSANLNLFPCSAPRTRLSVCSACASLDVTWLPETPAITNPLGLPLPNWRTGGECRWQSLPHPGLLATEEAMTKRDKQLDLGCVGYGLQPPFLLVPIVWP
jgi:hypothetical protein